MERDVRFSIRGLLYSEFGDAPQPPDAGKPGCEVGMVLRQGGFLSLTANLASLPSWLTDADLDFYVNEFTRTGFRGGLNWYRNIDRSWKLLAPFAGKQVAIPRPRPDQPSPG